MLFAFGEFETGFYKTVLRGTGWSMQMALDPETKQCTCTRKTVNNGTRPCGTKAETGTDSRTL